MATDEQRAIVVLVTTGSAENAEAIAQALVAEGIAACVNILPGVRSVYRWKEEVAVDSEWLLLIKTVRVRFATVEARVRSLHPYEVPEVIALDVVAGSKAYLEWLSDAATA